MSDPMPDHTPDLVESNLLNSKLLDSSPGDSILGESSLENKAKKLDLKLRDAAALIELDPDLVAELAEVTNDPSQAVNAAIRQWLQRRAIKEADTSRPLAMNPIVPPRGEWND